MKAKLAVILVPALALGVLAVNAEAQQHRATRLGNPATRFAKKPPRKPDDVRVLLRSEKMKADVVAILKAVRNGTARSPARRHSGAPSRPRA